MFISHEKENGEKVANPQFLKEPLPPLADSPFIILFASNVGG